MDKSLSSVSKDTKPFSIKSIINKPLGSWYSIIFWDDLQKQIILFLCEILFDKTFTYQLHYFRKKTICILDCTWRFRDG